MFFYARAGGPGGFGGPRACPIRCCARTRRAWSSYLVPKAPAVTRTEVAQTGEIIFEDDVLLPCRRRSPRGDGAVYGLPAKQRLVSTVEPGLPLKTLKPAEAPAVPVPQAYSSAVQARS